MPTSLNNPPDQNQTVLALIVKVSWPKIECRVWYGFLENGESLEGQRSDCLDFDLIKSQ